MLTPVWDKLNGLFHVNLEGRAHHVFCIVRTFIVVNIGWYFDRIVDPTDLATCFYNTLFNFAPAEFVGRITMLVDAQQSVGLLLVIAATCFVFVVSVFKERGHDVASIILKWPAPARGILYACVIIAIATSFLFAAGGQFMYANF